jgi:hypothetical protein
MAYKHIAIQPRTFNQFKTLKLQGYRSDDAFLRTLLDIYLKKKNNELARN